MTLFVSCGETRIQFCRARLCSTKSCSRPAARCSSQSQTSLESEKARRCCLVFVCLRSPTIVSLHLRACNARARACNSPQTRPTVLRARRLPRESRRSRRRDPSALPRKALTTISSPTTRPTTRRMRAVAAAARAKSRSRFVRQTTAVRQRAALTLTSLRCRRRAPSPTPMRVCVASELTRARQRRSLLQRHRRRMLPHQQSERR